MKTALLVLLSTLLVACGQKDNPPTLFKASNSKLQYVGRIDLSNPELPRYWAPGVYVKARFSGAHCKIMINDQVLYGNNHNYISVQIDDQSSQRIKLTGKVNVLDFSDGLSEGQHEITIAKATEGGVGYITFAGIEVEALLDPPALPARKIEFIGNSITCGYGADDTEIACKTDAWYDQHDAFNSHGALTARNLKAQYHLTAVSGIGLIHSCCNMDILMPQVYDKINMRGDTIAWDHTLYQPDVVSISLGQNDGIQDSTAFCSSYVQLVERIRGYYPEATIICVGSPMADDKLWPVMESYLPSVVAYQKAKGEDNIAPFFYEARYTSGCDYHPNNNEQGQMAEQLTAFISGLKGW
jgi:hypothetical protein